MDLVRIVGNMYARPYSIKGARMPMRPLYRENHLDHPKLLPSVPDHRVAARPVRA